MKHNPFLLWSCLAALLFMGAATETSAGGSFERAEDAATGEMLAGFSQEGPAFPRFDGNSAILANPYTASPVGGKLTYRGFGDAVGIGFYMEALGTEQVNGVNCLKVATKLSIDAIQVFWFAEDIEGNIWQLQQFDGLTGETFDELVLYMPANPVVGETYDLWDVAFDSAYTVLSTTETVSLSTGLGPYQNCLRFRLSDDGETEDWYFTPGLGLIKVQFSGFENGGWELASIDGFVPSVPPAASAPTITQQPQPRSIAAGQSVTLSFIAAGAAPLTYQWRKDGQDILGANSTELTIRMAQPADAGRYSVLVSNTAGSTLSAEAELSVVTLSLSGAIRENDGRGSAVPEVTLTLRLARSAQTTITDNQGAYSFTGLAAGIYSVTPSHPDFIFNPESVTVDLSADMPLTVFIATRTVAAPPVLKVQISGGAVTISWPDSLGEYLLERTDSLDSADGWTPVTISPAAAEDTRTISLPLDLKAAFFRLRKP